MGYYTTNTKLDGSFRSISVRVKRPGLTVRARKGYRGFTSAELSRGGAGTSPRDAAGAAAGTAAPLVPPAVSFSARAQFRVRAAAWSRPAASGTAGAFWVVGELDQQTKRQAAWSGSAQVDVAVIAADGAQVATRRLDLRPADGAFTVEFPDAPGAAAGDYTVRIRLRSPVDGELALSDTVRVSVKDGTLARRCRDVAARTVHRPAASAHGRSAISAQRAHSPRAGRPPRPSLPRRASSIAAASP